MAHYFKRDRKYQVKVSANPSPDRIKKRRVLSNDEKEYRLVPMVRSRERKKRDIRSPNRCGIRFCRIATDERTNCPGLTSQSPVAAPK